MGGDGLAELDAAQVLFGGVVGHLAAVEPLVVVELHVAGLAVLVGHDAQDAVAVRIGLELARGLVNVVQFVERTRGALERAAFELLGELDHCARRMLGAHLDILQVHVAVRAAHAHHLDALDLDALDQALVVGIQRVERKHGVVALLVRGGVVEAEQRIELLHGLARGTRLLTHLLRLIDDEDGIGGGEHVDGTTAAKVIALGEHDARRLVAAATLLALGLVERVERLHVDDHDGNIRTTGEGVDLV